MDWLELGLIIGGTSTIVVLANFILGNIVISKLASGFMSGIQDITAKAKENLPQIAGEAGNIANKFSEMGVRSGEVRLEKSLERMIAEDSIPAEFQPIWAMIPANWKKWLMKDPARRIPLALGMIDKLGIKMPSNIAGMFTNTATQSSNTGTGEYWTS